MLDPQEPEQEEGPNTESQNPEERIAARRGRIDKRREAQRRAARGEDIDAKKDVKEEQSKSSQQTEISRQRLAKKQKEGVDLVSNVRVAGDAREVLRRNEEEDAKRQRKERLESEAKAGAERFEEITKKWELALQKEIPQELHEMLMQQKGSCDAMIDEKNKLINDFESELRGKDDQYVKDLKKQAEDVDLLIDRMEHQVKDLTKSDRAELGQIEESFVTERKEMLEQHMGKWAASMQQRREQEEDHMKAREKRVGDNERDLELLRKQDAEEYNDVKIQLEQDVQLLEQNLQTMKATYQLNQEKLEYNYQVLKKRDDENTITKSQQKRKITKMQDSLTHLRQKLVKQEKMFKDENHQLTEDYKRVSEQFRDLQRKSKHFVQTDVQKFHDVWEMNEAECKELLRRTLDLDRVIHEQQLGLQWEEPDVGFLENTGPVRGENFKPKQATAMQVAQEAFASTTGAGSQQDALAKSETRSSIVSTLGPQTIKHVLELLCDESGFLVESKLKRLLQPLDKDEQSLMKLDAIFTALGVDTEDDIQLLVNFFMQFRIGSDRSTVPRPERELDDDQDLGDDDIPDSASQRDEFAADDEVAQITAEGDSPRSLDSAGPRDSLVHPNDVVKALRSFVEEHRKKKGGNAGASQFKIDTVDDRDDSFDEAYWKKYSETLDERKGKVWDALTEGLQGYSDVLTSRSELLTETEALRQQNAELRLLLHQYINSKVNAELEIPPTRVLQLE